MDLQRKVYRMNWPKLKSFAGGRLGRMVVVLGVAGLLLGAGAGAAEAAMGTQPGTVDLVPNTGPVNSTPTWATSVSCPSGFQGSATFKEVHSDGATTNLIAPIVNGTAAPFTGTLETTIANIKAAGGIANGGTQELFVTCYSAQSGTGNSEPYMNIFIQYSADGTTYSTSSSQGVPVGEVGGIAFAGLAAIGLTWMQLRRRSRRTQPSTS